MCFPRMMRYVDLFEFGFLFGLFPFTPPPPPNDMPFTCFCVFVIIPFSCCELGSLLMYPTDIDSSVNGRNVVFAFLHMMMELS